jgi:phosphinothricin acetyltransferase
MASLADAPACLAIYAPLVAESAISFEEQVPDETQFAQRIEATLMRHPWLVCELDGEIAGYAYASPFRTRAAYRWTAEVSVAVRAGSRRRNVGQATYTALLAFLALQRMRSAVAVIALPNDASLRLHERLGFRPIGTLEDAGWKFGEWRDIAIWQRLLGEAAAHDEPLTPAVVMAMEEWEVARRSAEALLR